MNNKFSFLIGLILIQVICGVTIVRAASSTPHTLEKVGGVVGEQKEEISQHLAVKTLQQIQQYNDLGQLELALFNLEKILPSLEKQEDTTLLAIALTQLGDNYVQKQKYDTAIKYYKKSLASKKTLATLNNLSLAIEKKIDFLLLSIDSSRKGAETQKYLAQLKQSRKEQNIFLQEAISTSSNSVNEEVMALIRWGQINQLSKSQLKSGSKKLLSLPPKKEKLFLIFNWAKLVPEEKHSFWLEQARQLALKLKDDYFLANAILEQGLLAEKQNKDDLAKDLAQQSIDLAQKTNNNSILYKAWWLLGRIEQDFYYYKESILSLSSDSSQNLSSTARLNFANDTEPLYREALQLLLQKPTPSPDELNLALKVFEKLQFAQLQQYFGDDCSIVKSQVRSSKTKKYPQSATLTSIVMPDGIHLILKLPNGEIKHHKSLISKGKLENLVSDWYAEMALYDGMLWQFQIKSHEIYQYLIKPIEPFLQQTQLIVFVSDGILRNLPTAALFDGRQYLAQKWASVSSLGFDFQVIPSQTKPKTIAFGLSVARGDWNSLSSVPQEVEIVTQLTGGRKFLDRQFTRDTLSERLEAERYSQVHFATHAYFGGLMENSFVLAHDLPIPVNDLENILSQQSIDLLVLSACETALSSPLSPLGLSGIGIRNNIPYILGTFWQVDDTYQTELIGQFYRHSLNSDYPFALQKTQVNLIEQGENPASWASLNLVVN